MSKIDKIDFKIIEILTRDARRPFNQVAKELNIGTDTVFRRFKRLQKRGIIKNPTIVLDSRMCGFEGEVDFLIKTKPGADTTKIQTQLVESGNVKFTAKTLGDHNLYCCVLFRNFKDLTEIVERIREIKDIVTVDPVIYMEQSWTIPSTSYSTPAVPTRTRKKNLIDVFR